MITVSCFLDHLLKPQFPPPILFNEQRTSGIMKTWHGMQYWQCLVLDLLKCQSKRISIVKINYWRGSIKRGTQTIPENSGTSFNQLFNDYWPLVVPWFCQIRRNGFITENHFRLVPGKDKCEYDHVLHSWVLPLQRCSRLGRRNKIITVGLGCGLVRLSAS